jgi:excisionase family DNA binding protein
MDDNRLLTPQEAAAYLGVDEGTLKNWRSSKRVEIPYVKMGEGRTSPVRYRKRELDAWVSSRMVTA